MESQNKDKFTSIEEFIKWNNFHTTGKRRFLFRGVSNEVYPLIPKISRDNRDKTKAVDEDIAIERQIKLKEYLNLRLPAYGVDLHHFSKIKKSWREIMIGQHYGAPTQLLDFSRNPMAALYFASKNKGGTGKLWAITIKKKYGNYEDIVHNDPAYNIGSYDLLSGENAKDPYEF
jgi:FRG domain